MLEVLLKSEYTSVGPAFLCYKFYQEHLKPLVSGAH